MCVMSEGVMSLKTDLIQSWFDAKNSEDVVKTALARIANILRDTDQQIHKLIDKEEKTGVEIPKLDKLMKRRTDAVLLYKETLAILQGRKTSTKKILRAKLKDIIHTYKLIGDTLLDIEDNVPKDELLKRHLENTREELYELLKSIKILLDTS